MTSCRAPRTFGPETEFVRRSQPLLGTFVVVAAYGHDRTALHSAISAAFAEVRRVDAMMSIHRADSEVAHINATAAKAPVIVSEELFKVLLLAQQIARETDGSLDLTIRPVAQMWGFIWKEYRLPHESELAATLPRVNHQFIILDETNRTVRFATNGVSIDLGAIGKGYAVDCAMAKLRQAGIGAALIRAGGDLLVMGAPPGQEAWTVQLEDPEKQGKRTFIQLRDAAVSTSGDYENFFTINGRRYSHILNPRTGLPVTGVAACSVIADTCVESDAWATALFVYGPERAVKKFGARFPLRFVVPDGASPRVISSRFPRTTSSSLPE